MINVYSREIADFAFDWCTRYHIIVLKVNILNHILHLEHPILLLKYIYVNNILSIFATLRFVLTQLPTHRYSDAVRPCPILRKYTFSNCYFQVRFKIWNTIFKNRSSRKVVSKLEVNSFHTKTKTIYWSVHITYLILIVIMFIQFIWVHALLIRQSGDNEMSSGPRPNPCHSFSIVIGT